MCSDGDDETVFDALDENCECVGIPAVYGCTDPDACNYEEALGANVDDGSCYEMGVGNISGSVFPFAGDEFVYTYNGVEEHTDLVGGWRRNHRGQGTSEVTVLWGTEDTFGAVYVFEEDATGCQGEAVRTVQILDVSNVDDLEVVEALLMPNPARGQCLSFGMFLSTPSLEWSCTMCWEQRS